METDTNHLNSFGEITEYKLQSGENKKDYSYTCDSDSGTPIYSLNNLQGDIVPIFDANGNTVVEYTYDIWG